MAGVTAITFSKVFATSKPTETTTATATTTTTTTTATEYELLISAFKFEPDSLTIKAGDTVTWLNKDIVPHTATATDKSWDTGNIKTHQRKSITFSKASSTSYFCAYHPSMQAKLNIIVED